VIFLPISIIPSYALDYGALATVSMHNKDISITRGVLKLDVRGTMLIIYRSRTLSIKVSMWIYIFNRRTLEHIEKGKYLDFPVLIKQLIEKGEKMVGYDFDGYWMDIGRHEDYSKVLEKFDSRKDKLF
jgi:NDP-sugar pyrophosphorylase family protein